MKNPLLHTLEINYMHSFEESLTEDFIVKIILPEGATNISIELPSSLKNKDESISMGKYFGTLDIFGRPMVTIRQSNAVHDLCDDIIRVKYLFNNSTSLYLEPAIVFAMVLSLYLVAMIYSRIGLDLKSKKVSPQEKGVKNE